MGTWDGSQSSRNGRGVRGENDQEVEACSKSSVGSSPRPPCENPTVSANRKFYQRSVSSIVQPVGRAGAILFNEPRHLSVRSAPSSFVGCDGSVPVRHPGQLDFSPQEIVQGLQTDRFLPMGYVEVERRLYDGPDRSAEEKQASWQEHELEQQDALIAEEETVDNQKGSLDKPTLFSRIDQKL